MARVLLNARIFKLIVLIAHLVLVGVIAILFSELNIGEAPRIAALESLSSLYSKTSLSWISTWQEIAFAVIALFDFTVGILLIRFGLRRSHQVAKYFMVGIGSQLVFSGFLSATLLGLIIWGGLWYFASVIVAVTMAGSALIVFSMLILFWESLNALGEKQDKSLQEREDTA